jgi:hypothetical protein
VCYKLELTIQAALTSSREEAKALAWLGEEAFIDSTQAFTRAPESSLEERNLFFMDMELPPGCAAAATAAPPQLRGGKQG